MPKLTEIQRLEVEADDFFILFQNELSVQRMAEQFYIEHRELVATVADQWILSNLVKLFRHRRTKADRANNLQLVFEGMLGFKRLPAAVEIKGQRVRRSDFHAGEWKRLVAELRKQKSPALVEALKAQKIHRRYSKKERYITWAEVLELEAAKKTPNP